MKILTKDDVYNACLGGGVLGCGGGGWYDHGIRIGLEALKIGQVKLVTADELADDDIVVTVSVIGTPAAKNWQLNIEDYSRSVQLLQHELKRKIAAFMTAQNGYSTTINGWLQSALLDIPVLDAAGDFRAHPTIKLGSMGLTSNREYQTIQTAAGGNRQVGRYLEATLKGKVVHTSNLIRSACVESGGFIVSARNPISVRYVKEHGALGSISAAIKLGQKIREYKQSESGEVANVIADYLNGRVMGTGVISDLVVERRNGYDYAHFHIDTENGEYEIKTLNEHIVLKKNGALISTYPDIITLISSKDGFPMPTYQSEKGQTVHILSAHASHLPKSSGISDIEALKEIFTLIDESPTLLSGSLTSSDIRLQINHDSRVANL